MQDTERLGVEPGPDGAGQVVIQGLAEQRVREIGRGAWLLGDQPAQA